MYVSLACKSVKKLIRWANTFLNLSKSQPLDIDSGLDFILVINESKETPVLIILILNASNITFFQLLLFSLRVRDKIKKF